MYADPELLTNARRPIVVCPNVPSNRRIQVRVELRQPVAIDRAKLSNVFLAHLTIDTAGLDQCDEKPIWLERNAWLTPMRQRQRGRSGHPHPARTPRLRFPGIF